MKLKHITSYFFILYSIFLFSQESGIITYKAYDNGSLTIDVSDNETEKKAKQMLLEALNLVQDFNYTLKFNDNESLFSKEESLLNDGNKNSNYYYLANAMVGKGVFYQSKEDNLILKQLSVTGTTFLISNNLFTDWEITKETKKINGFLCFKAIRKCETCPNKESESVWFTPDIPVSFGPLGYGGLPGLVVEVKKGLLITIRLETIEYSDKVICIDKPQKGKEITLEEYIKITNKYREDARNY